MDELSNLQVKFSEYMVAKRNLEFVTNECQDIKRNQPVQPTVITRQDQLDSYAKEVTRWSERLSAAQDEQKRWENEVRRMHQEVAQAIPLEHTLFLVYFADQDYGICSFLDVWGGAHTDWKARPWSDDLKPLADQTHYD